MTIESFQVLKFLLVYIVYPVFIAGIVCFGICFCINACTPAIVRLYSLICLEKQLNEINFNKEKKNG